MTDPQADITARVAYEAAVPSQFAPRPPLIGRREELERVLGIVAQRRRAGGALMVTGEAGIGKTALLSAAVDAARAQGRIVLEASGVESEACIPFGMLQQLLHPVLRAGHHLAPDQQAVLDAALGFMTGSAPDIFRTALAALELLSDVGTTTPVLAVVDDAQWADPATATVLGFVARRLHAEPVIVLAGVRTTAEAPADASGKLARWGLPELALEPLDAVDAARVLDSVGLRDEHERTRVLQEAAGNPLALLELPHSLGWGQWEQHGAPVPLTARLERAFSRRLEGLSPAARSALLVAAAQDSDDPAELLVAIQRLHAGDAPPGPETYAPVLDRGLLVLSRNRVRFGHPLVRSAVYQASTPRERAEAHRAWADTLAAEPDRRAWHLAAATLVPDATAADEVTAAAERAEGRGAFSVVAYALERAAALTPRGQLRGQRLLRAAEVAVELGDVARAASLLGQAEPLLSAESDPCRVALLQEALRPHTAGDAVRVRHLVSLAERAQAADDTNLAVGLLHAAGTRVWSTECGPEARDLVVRGVGNLALDRSDPRVLAVLGLADPQGHETEIETGLGMLSIAPLGASSLGLVTSPYLVSANPNLAALQAAELDRLRGQGRLRLIPLVVATHAWAEICLGHWSAATGLADEGVRLSEELEQPLWTGANLVTKAMLAAMAGNGDEATDLCARAEALLLPMGIGAALSGVQLVRSVEAIAAGRYEDALASSRRVFDPADPAFHRVQAGWHLAELATAAAYCGRRREAREILARYEEPGGSPCSPWAAMAVEFARPILAEDADADALFVAALSGRVATWPAYRARLLLEYGIWLRRHRRVSESRQPLRSAREACDALGMRPWAERARAELRAAGEGSSPGEAAIWTRLSPQELQIALLATRGLSNREIGLKLFLSHRTVGSHLYRMFPKLGITSRRQLRDLFDEHGARA